MRGHPLYSKSELSMPIPELKIFLKLDPPFDDLDDPDFGRKMEGWRQRQWYAEQRLRRLKGLPYDGHHEPADYTCGMC